MARVNKSLIGELQNKNLDEKISDSISSLDLNWLGCNRSDANNLFRRNTQAHINRCLLWLASKPNDYVRESIKGGVLYSLLGQINSDTNLTEWETSIRDRFNAEFANDLDLMYITLTPDKKYKTLKIEMVVRDRLENTTFTVATETNI